MLGLDGEVAFIPGAADAATAPTANGGMDVKATRSRARYRTTPFRDRRHA
jgi:hypothetical protein